ncbi:MAG: hypothetical protein ACYCZN_01520 [Candidatus Dormibacteria bacterium]
MADQKRVAEIREYRKKPVVVQAVRFRGKANLSECARFCAGSEAWVDDAGRFVCAVGDANAIAIDTTEGIVAAREGDWIIRDAAGGYYLCKPDIFRASYEPADQGPGMGAELERLRARVKALEAIFAGHKIEAASSGTLNAHFRCAACYPLADGWPCATAKAWAVLDEKR